MGMLAMSHRPPLYFLHIPKTAGTSIHAWLSGKYAFEQVFAGVDPAEVAGFAPADLDGYRYYSGHLGMGFSRRLKTEPRVVTWLRDPASRLFSSYNYLRSLDSEALRLLTDPFARAQREQALNLTFDQWVRLPQRTYAMHNLMAYSLAAPDARGTAILDSAKANLKSLAHFGLVERMQDSIDLLCFLFRWQPEEFTFYENRTQGQCTGSFSNATLAAIRKQNQLDIVLYNFARSLFDRRIRDMRSKLNLAGVDRARSLEAMRRWFREKNVGSLAATGWCSLDAARVGGGWVRPIRNADGRFVRWTGPEADSVLYLDAPRGDDLLISFMILSVMDAEILGSLRLELNGAPLAHSIEPSPLPDYPFAHLCQAKVSATLLDREPGLARLVFRVSRTFPEPAASDPIAGPKHLGLCLEEVKVRRIA